MVPFAPFTLRGWLLLGAGALALLLAIVLGRRDLLTLAIFCLALPAVACAGLFWFKPGITLKRYLSPSLARAGSSVSVVLDVRGHAPGGSRARIAEELPYSFHDSPTFEFPNPTVPRGLLSRYHYQVVPTRRGVFTVGPLRAQFSDPFGVAFLQRKVDDGGELTVAPAAVDLAPISLSDGRGQDGSRTTKELAHASHDDAMTREYRPGDPLRRVHWPVTARQGKLMVRAEESVTAPEAAMILDLRPDAYGTLQRPLSATNRRGAAGISVAGLSGAGMSGRSSSGSGFSGSGSSGSGFSGSHLRTTAVFETAVKAVVSITGHLLERGYLLRVLDQEGNPGFASSASAIAPEVEDFSGSQGVFDVAAALAALELSGEATPTPATAARFASAPRAAVEASPFGHELAHKLHHGRRRGPLVAVTGALTDLQARQLADIAESTQSAYALLLCHDPAEVGEALEILRAAGWRAAALTPADSLEEVWLQLDRSNAVRLAP